MGERDLDHARGPFGATALNERLPLPGMEVVVDVRPFDLFLKLLADPFLDHLGRGEGRQPLADLETLLIRQLGGVPNAFLRPRHQYRASSSSRASRCIRRSKLGLCIHRYRTQSAPSSSFFLVSSLGSRSKRVFAFHSSN